LKFQQLLRSLVKSPSLSLTVILSLGFGIGANTLAFSIANSLFLRPPAGAAPERLALVYTSYKGGLKWGSTSYPDYRDVAAAGEGAFRDLAAERIVALSLGVEPFNRRLYGSMVSPNYFRTLGMGAVLGRTFAPGEGASPGDSTVIVLSHDAWGSTFGGEPGWIGRPLEVNGVRFTVIGVMPKGFRGSNVGYDPQFWLPLQAETLLAPGSTFLERRDLRSLFVLGRLAEGVSLDQASARLAAVATRLATTFPVSNGNIGFSAIPAAEGTLHPLYRGTAAVAIGLVFAVVAIVLLTACANLAALLLARLHGRRREIGICLALGSSRRSLFARLLAESMVLSLLGAGLAVLLALVGTRLLESFSPVADLPIHLDLALDHRVLAFTLAVSLLTGLLFGLLPAFQATRAEVLRSIQQDGSGGGRPRSRLRTLFVAGQLVCSTVLLISAGLVARGLREAQHVDLGFKPAGVATAAVDLSLRNYSATAGWSFYHQLSQRLEAMPQVQSVAWASSMPLELFGNQREVQPLDDDRQGAGAKKLVSFNVVDPAYFRTLGIPLLQGREFTDQDSKGTPTVAIVNRTLADLYWPQGKAIGRRLKADDGEVEVVGVVADTRAGGLDNGASPFLYFPFFQEYWSNANVLVRTASRPQSFLPTLQTQVQALDPSLALYRVETLEEHLEVFLMLPRAVTWVLSGFGLLAMLLAGMGLYGTLAYGISQRSREIGIRLSLGAKRGDIVGMVVGEGMRLTLFGLAIGLLAAAGLTRFLRSVLYGVSPLDPVVFFGSALFVLGVALLASYLSARRAAALEPFTILRSESK
jgi:putative ABC transport system permease protein